MSIVEILISLSIAALLLTATAAAFDAAFESYQINNDLTLVSTSSRNALHQICATIRSAWNDPDVALISASTDGTELSLTDANGRDIIYRYDANTSQLQVNINADSNWYVMVDNVSAIAAGEKVFTTIAPASSHFDFGTVGKVIIRFCIQQGDFTQPVSAGVVPRNIVYER